MHFGTIATRNPSIGTRDQALPVRPTDRPSNHLKQIDQSEQTEACDIHDVMVRSRLLTLS